MIWLLPLSLFLLISTQITLLSLDSYNLLFANKLLGNNSSLLQLVFYESQLDKVLAYSWVVVWLFFISHYFSSFAKVVNNNYKLVFFYFFFIWVFMLVFFYFFFSIIFWLNLNIFVDYSVYSINLFLIFFFNLVYSLFFKFSKLEKKIVNLLA